MTNTNTIQQNSLYIRHSLVTQLHGKDVYKIYLVSGNISMMITNIGCSIVSLETQDKDGVFKNIVSGFNDIDEYFINRDYMGCVVGRYANRIANGKFAIDGKQFQLPVNIDSNHLHGGVEGFNKKIWDIQDYIEKDDCVGVVFSYLSKDGEEGYPGNLQVTVTYLLNKQNQLYISYGAETDKATPVNLTNHSYFNLTGFENPLIDDHLLQVNAVYYTEKNEQNIPTGTIKPISGTALDFSNPKEIGTGINDFPLDLGYDHNFIIDKSNPEELVFAAKLYEPVSGRVVKVYTTQPGIQVYTANYWDGTIKGLQKKFYQKHGAVALETQSFPDSPNQCQFPDTIIRPGQQYCSKTIYAFDIE
ncbi:MAG: aldose epimerase family protein [Ferruginibacter sp.]